MVTQGRPHPTKFQPLLGIKIQIFLTKKMLEMLAFTLEKHILREKKIKS